MKISESMLMLANVMTMTPTIGPYTAYDKRQRYTTSATPKQLNKRRKAKLKRKQGKNK